MSEDFIGFNMCSVSKTGQRQAGLCYDYPLILEITIGPIHEIPFSHTGLILSCFSSLSYNTDVFKSINLSLDMWVVSIS